MEPLYKDESYAIMGAAFEVYRNLGTGFLEAVYHEALERELTTREIPYSSHAKLEIIYKGKPLSKHYEADFICYDKIILELKAAKSLDNTHRAQLQNYLRATGHRLGILLNFGHYPKIQSERIIR